MLAQLSSFNSITSTDDLIKNADQINSYLNHLDKIHQDFSGQILIYKNDEEIYYQSRGYANAEFQVKAKRNTKYNIASIISVALRIFYSL